MSKSIPLVAVGLLLPAVAFAQATKIAGTLVCDPPAKETAIPVEGQPDHAYAVNQLKCAWTKPWQIGGIAAKDGVATGMLQVVGNTSESSGTYVDTMANGDKAYYKYSFTATMKDGKPQAIANHKWEMLGGTGKLATAKGKGTCKVTAQGEGRFLYDCEGEVK
jgi:hypothetical protein